MKEQLLMILEKNARLSIDQLASLLNITPQQAAAEIEKLEKEGVILGYRSIIDWDKTDRDVCHARIEVQVTPEGGVGFEDIAARICQFEEVETVYLMSGGYDIAVTITGKTFKDVALFVAHRLSPLEGVRSTATSFVLRKYKERGCNLLDQDGDGREVTNL